MSKSDRDSKKVKLAFCSCGCGGWISLADLPYAESDRDMMKEFSVLESEGCRTEVMTFAEYVFNDYLAGCQKIAQVVELLKKSTQSLVFFDASITPITDLGLSRLQIIRIMKQLRSDGVVESWNGFTPSGSNVMVVTSCTLTAEWMEENCPRAKRYTQMKLF